MLSPQDVELLEKRRFKYKLKRFLKFSIPFLLLFSMVGGYFLSPKIDKLKNIKIDYSFLNFLKFDNNKTEKEEIKRVVVVEEKKEVESSIPKKIEPQPIVIKEEKEKYKNSANRIANADILISKKEKDETLKLHTAFLENLDRKRAEPDIESLHKKEPKKVKKSPIKIESKKLNRKPKRRIVRKKIIDKPPKEIDISFDGKNIEYLEKMFKKTNKFKYAIALAEEYYNRKEYQKSIKWSMIANDIDNKDDRSWIYFAKSKVKLNHRDEAIEALRLFLKKNRSRGVSNLLTRIEHGAL